jgi:hypothetical protein
VYSFQTQQLGGEEMNTKDFTAAFVMLAIATNFASASLANDCYECTGTGTATGTDGGGGTDPEVKGNNGWGNGPDSTNAGSFSGATAVTKSVNGLGVDKFDGKFTGR